MSRDKVICVCHLIISYYTEQQEEYQKHQKAESERLKVFRKRVKTMQPLIHIILLYYCSKVTYYFVGRREN